MSSLRFDGQGAGLGKRQSGDANDPCSYTLICVCGFDLGPLARFRPNAANWRTCRCLVCDAVTIVTGTSIGRVLDGKAFDAEYDAQIHRYLDHLRGCAKPECGDCAQASGSLPTIGRAYGQALRDHMSECNTPACRGCSVARETLASLARRGVQRSISLT